MIFIPIKSKVLVKPHPPKEVTKGGLIIPDTAKERPTEATVVAIGDSCVCVEAGDVVVYDKFCGKEITIDVDDEPQTFVIIWEDEISLIKKETSDASNTRI